VLYVCVNACAEVVASSSFIAVVEQKLCVLAYSVPSDSLMIMVVPVF
jgi:hypothetical protein